MKHGVTFLGQERCRFAVWAPFAQKVDVHIVAPQERLLPLEQDAEGYYSAHVESVQPGSRYFYRLDGDKEYPDPASRFQPEGVHGSSQTLDAGFVWEDANWAGLPLHQYIVYEIHVGTFTPEGTFDAVISLLDGLKETGISALEIMPVAQFPGNRNWGYDGVYPFAVQNSYGGPDGLKRLVNACHKREMAVVIDVVYNHLGPEGNYCGEFGPYFTDRYQTPWGKAVNFDGPSSDFVRSFFIENALYWLSEFHVDALRLDALHAMFDFSPHTFLDELVASVDKLRSQAGRRMYLIGESDANDRRLVQSTECGGYGLDAQWNDDFHHALHALLTGEHTGYYQDFGLVAHLAKAFQAGFVYSGEYSSYRQRCHGSSSDDIPAERFVVFAQNHDQVGNRMLGERLSQLVPFEVLKLAAGVILVSPFIPLMFMGEEYGDPAPFQYFTSHSDPSLVEAIREGRRKLFAASERREEVPDPQDEATFLRSRLSNNLRHEGRHRVLREFYEKLISLRNETPALSCLSKDNMEVVGRETTKVLCVRRWTQHSEAMATFNFRDVQSSVSLSTDGQWEQRVNSAEPQWLGSGGSSVPRYTFKGETELVLAPNSFVLFTRSKDV